MRNLPQERQDINRSEVHSSLRQANLPKDRSLTREKQENFRKQKSRDSIAIVNGDKKLLSCAEQNKHYGCQVREMLQLG